MDIPQGTLLYNRYRVERQLGQGGMGAVYLAFDTSLEAWVAVKVNHRATGESTTQFLREAHLLASLRNPNLPRVIDYFILDQSQYLVMDYIPGDDLALRLQKEGVQPYDHVLQWARQLGNALAYLHSQNPPVIHRDIKPANIKLTPDGDVVLVDFGIAKATDPSQATATGAAGYTPGFAPPEQYGSAHTGPYSDQFSFAATLYMLLTGQQPMDSIKRVLNQGSLVPLRKLNPTVPEQMATAIERALSVRPEDRFINVDEMVMAMGSTAFEATVRRPDDSATVAVSPANQPTRVSMASMGATAQTTVAVSQPTRVAQPISAAPTPTPARVWVKYFSIAAVVLLAIAVIAVLGGLALKGNGGSSKGSAQLGGQSSPTVMPATVLPSNTPIPPQPTATAIPPTDAPPIVAVPSDTPTPEPSPNLAPAVTAAPVGGGGLIAFSSNRGDGTTFQIWTMKVTIGAGGQVQASDFTQLTSGEGDKTQPRWSPDGLRLLYVAPGGNLGGKITGLDIWVMNSDGSNPQNLTNRVGDDLDPAWSPDGSIVAFSNNGREDRVRQIFFMNPDGKNQVRLSLDFSESMPTWAPDMRWLIYVISANNYPFLYMRSSNAGYQTPEPYDTNTIHGRLGQVAQPAWSPDGNQIAYVRLDGGQKQLWSVVYNSRGANLARLTSGNSDQDPAWSPDSRWILYSSQSSGNQEVWLMTSAGTLQTNLTSDSGTDKQPAWQPLPKP